MRPIAIGLTAALALAALVPATVISAAKDKEKPAAVDAKAREAGMKAAPDVAKLDPTGRLIYASAIGGTLADSSIGQAIAVDAAGHAYVTGIAATHPGQSPTRQRKATRQHQC